MKTNWFKRFFTKLAYSIPFAMKGGEDAITGGGSDDGLGHTVQQRVTDKRVAQHLLKAEVTQEVEELRYRTYKVSNESENFQYIGNGVAVKNKNKKKSAEKTFYRFSQENELVVNSVLEELNRVDQYGKEEYRFEFTYNGFPRFKMEQFATQVDVDIDDKTGKIDTKFHFNTQPNPYDMKSKPFINELDKMSVIKNEADAERNEIASYIDTFSFCTYKPTGEDSLVTYSFSGGAKFKQFEKTTNEFLVTYSWNNYTRVPLDLEAKYYSKEMAKKYEKKERKETVASVGVVERKRYCTVCGREMSVYDGDILESQGKPVICTECMKSAMENNEGSYNSERRL